MRPGAEVVGSEALIASIQADGAGAIPFDKCLATAAMMPKLARIARILGPRGLMPNPKLGTIVDAGSMQEAIRAMKAGRIEFRCECSAYSSGAQVLRRCNGACSSACECLHALSACSWLRQRLP
jgi:ribosomal protein L1